jgi:hypothetical protein
MPMGVPAKAGDIKAQKNGYVLIKCIAHPIFGNRWVQRAHFVWWKWRKQVVPKGYLLHHKDEDPSRDVLSNLQLMTRAEHNKYHMIKSPNAHARRAHIAAALKTLKTRTKMSKSALARPPMTAATRRKMSRTRTGKKLGPSPLRGTKRPEAYKARMRKAMLGNTNALGIRHTKESIENMRKGILASWARKREERIDDYFSNRSRVTIPIEQIIQGEITKNVQL